MPGFLFARAFAIVIASVYETTASSGETYKNAFPSINEASKSMATVPARRCHRDRDEGFDPPREADQPAVRAVRCEIRHPPGPAVRRLSFW